MKNYKSLILAAIVLAGSIFTSCSKEGYWSKTDQIGKGYSMPAATLSYTFAPADDMTKVQIPIVRSESRNAATLSVTGTSTSAGYLSFPEVVEFGAGQKEAFYEIGIAKPFNIGQSVKATIKFDKSQVSTAGIDSTVVTIKLDYNWESIGKGNYNDAWTWSLPDFVEAEFFQAVENPKVFKIADPYTKMNADAGVSTKAGYSAAPFIQFQLLEPGDEIYGITITKKNLVYFSPFETGEYNTSYSAPIRAMHPAHFSSMSEPNFVNNAVLEYQENGLPAVVQFAPMFYMDGVGGYNYTGYSGVITFYFPDVPMYDYSVGVEYQGRQIDTYDNEFIKTGVSVGADVQDVWIAMSTLDEESLLYGMLDGSVPTTKIAAADIKDGVVLVPMNNEGTGKYNLMAISFGGPSEEEYDAQSYDVVQFAYSAGGEKETWVPVAGGTYTYSTTGKGTGIIMGMIGLPAVGPMNLYQSSINESKWRLWPYAAGGELIFYTDIYQEVYIEEGTTGISADGPLECIDAYYNGFAAAPGYFDPNNDVFHLTPGWVDWTAMSIYAYGEDTFEVTGEPYEFVETEVANKTQKLTSATGMPMPKHECKSVNSIDRNIKMTNVEVVD